ncbi:unnamed protein product [Orchesella dallaii]|uniref:Uncharacterized protein n=1 Tax=Orchesella dallaii TaxID=48710 RepID=A0ABP1RR96_9HEXA
MAQSPKIDAALSQTLASKGVATVVVSFNLETQQVLDQINGMTFSNRGDKTTFMKTELEKLAATNQKNVLELLQNRSPAVQFKSMWISNQVIINNATKEVVESVANVPEVTTIREEHTATIMQ